MDDSMSSGILVFSIAGTPNRTELYEKQRLKTEGTAGFTSSPWAYRGHIFA